MYEEDKARVEAEQKKWMTRTSIKFVGQSCRDYHYYKEKGWFESDYFYPTSLGLIEKLAGHLLDFTGLQIVKQQ